MTGRPRDAIWSHFIEIAGGKSQRVKCIECNAELSGLVKRMKEHYTKCSRIQGSLDPTSDDEIIEIIGAQQSSKLV